MSGYAKAVVPEPLRADAWAPFGWIPVADTDPDDGAERMTFQWEDAHVNLIGHARSEVPQLVHGLGCEMLFRHDTHTQALMALDVPAVIAVAPADADFENPEQIESIRVFRLEPLEPFVLHRGTWHWGPFPVAAEEVRLYNVQGLRYAEDNRCMDLAAKGLSVEVDLS